MGPTRPDQHIFACLCTRIESDRDTLALHEISLDTVCSLCFFLMFIRGDGTEPYPFWYRIDNLLAVSIEYAKAYVHLLRRCNPSRKRDCFSAGESPASTPARRCCCPAARPGLQESQTDHNAIVTLLPHPLPSYACREFLSRLRACTYHSMPPGADAFDRAVAWNRAVHTK